MKSLPVPIQKIIGDLDTIAEPDKCSLTAIVKESGLNQQDLVPYAHYDHNPRFSYGRHTIWSAPHYGIYAMSWNPGDFTAIHGHGHTDWGVVYFLGDTVHRSYRVQESEIHLISTAMVSEGSFLTICDRNYYHAMGNLKEKPFMTFHIYGSYEYEGVPNEDTRVFELEKNRISTTYGAAFINMEQKNIKSYTRGILTDSKTKEDYLECICPYYHRLGE